MQLHPKHHRSMFHCHRCLDHRTKSKTTNENGKKKKEHLKKKFNLRNDSEFKCSKLIPEFVFSIKLLLHFSLNWYLVESYRYWWILRCHTEPIRMLVKYHKIRCHLPPFHVTLVHCPNQQSWFECSWNCTSHQHLFQYKQNEEEKSRAKKNTRINVLILQKKKKFVDAHSNWSVFFVRINECTYGGNVL